MLVLSSCLFQFLSRKLKPNSLSGLSPRSPPILSPSAEFPPSHWPSCSLPPPMAQLSRRPPASGRTRGRQTSAVQIGKPTFDLRTSRERDALALHNAGIFPAAASDNDDLKLEGVEALIFSAGSPPSWQRVPLRRPDRLAGHGRQGAALPRADLQHAAQGLLLQRDTQQARRARDHVRAVHASTGTQEKQL